jgi:hypothetical protein
MHYTTLIRSMPLMRMTFHSIFAVIGKLGIKPLVQSGHEGHV